MNKISAVTCGKHVDGKSIETMQPLNLTDDFISLSTWLPNSSKRIEKRKREDERRAARCFAVNELCGCCAENSRSGVQPCPYRHCYEDFGGPKFCHYYQEAVA